MAPPILTLKPAARLKHFLSQWQILTQDPTILNIVQGYRLQFHTQPSQTVKPVTSVSKENIPILNAEISKLQLKGAIRPVNFTNAAFYSRLFLVPKKGGDLRPVIDLSALNQFVINEHFQMENISCLKQILNQNDFMIKLDLKDAYLTVGVHEQSQRYLRFIWQEHDRWKQARRLDVAVGTLDASLLDLWDSSVFLVLKVGELAD